MPRNPGMMMYLATSWSAFTFSSYLAVGTAYPFWLKSFMTGFNPLLGVQPILVSALLGHGLFRIYSQKFDDSQ